MWLRTYTYIGFQGDFRKVQKMEETKIDTIFNKGMYYAWLCPISTYVHMYMHTNKITIQRS